MTTNPSQELIATEGNPAQTLYHNLLAAWNRRDAAAFAGLFTDDAYVIGFDGSPMHGRAEIQTTLTGIFADHPTGAYTGKVRAVRPLSPDVTLVEAVAGITPAGQTELKPELNAMQTLVAVRQGEEWRITLYQNTPAQFHGRPEMTQALTDELRQVTS